MSDSSNDEVDFASGMAAFEAKHFSRAAQLLSPFAEQGNAEGLFGLAHMYDAGEGVEKNPGEAVRGFTLAAQQGHTQAIRVLAQAYETGELDLKVNYAEAVSWLNAGIAAQDAWSIRRLARAYRRGELGLRIDLEQAAFLEARLAQLLPQPAKAP